MGKRADSVIGIDLGSHVFKAVTLRRHNHSRLAVASFAVHEIPENLATADDLARELKQLLRDLNSGTKTCALAASGSNALLRIVEQPDTPVDLLRNALRLNGLSMLNQDCKEFVLDVAPLQANASLSQSSGEQSAGEGLTTATVQAGVATVRKYVVGGLSRSMIKQISEAITKTRLQLEILQVAPVCSFNAFEFAYPEIFANEPFLLLDMGHLQSTVLIGSKGELVLARGIEYGGKLLGLALTADGSLEKNAAWSMVQENDETMLEICRSSLVRLATEVRNSIGFFEGQREESVNQVFVSGGLARSERVLQMLSDELGLPCEIWDPLERCEVALSSAKRQALPEAFASLNVACGAALEYLTG